MNIIIVQEQNPNDAETYYKRGLLEINVDQKEKGCNDLSKAGGLGFIKSYDAIKLYCQ